MASFGWQEIVILFLFFMLTVLPVALVWRGSKRRTGKVSVGWVVVAVFFSWIGAFLWALVGRKAPRQQTPLAWNQPRDTTWKTPNRLTKPESEPEPEPDLARIDISQESFQIMLAKMESQFRS